MVTVIFICKHVSGHHTHRAMSCLSSLPSASYTYFVDCLYILCETGCKSLPSDASWDSIDTSSKNICLRYLQNNHLSICSATVETVFSSLTTFCLINAGNYLTHYSLFVTFHRYNYYYLLDTINAGIILHIIHCLSHFKDTIIIIY